MQRVTIIQELLTQYRVPFYERLRPELEQHGIELVLVHGRARGLRASRKDEAALPWAHVVENRYLRVGRSAEAVWQPVLHHGNATDLVVVEHANRQLVNYALLANRSLRRRPRLAFWGHGANLQATNPHSLAEQFKRRVATLADWWFAYTEGSAARVVSTGFPSERVTVVQNSIDTRDYPDAPKKTPGECVFVGSLHHEKRLDMLLEAGEMLADRVADFHLTVIGAGPMQSQIQEVANRSSWLTYAGPLFNESKAAAVAKANLLLMPGLVGLAILDGFAGLAPLVTTAYPRHSPEIEYLDDGVNGLISAGAPSVDSFVGLVASVLEDPGRLALLQHGCARARTEFSIDDMAQRFATGVAAALDAGRQGSMPR